MGFYKSVLEKTLHYFDFLKEVKTKKDYRLLHENLGQQLLKPALFQKIILTILLQIQ